jgi:GDP-L-fucose synthase
LASAIEFLLENTTNEELLNVGSGQEVQILELANLMKNIIGFTGELVFDTSMPDGNPRKLIDSTKINRLGWKPKISLEEGLSLTYKWFNNNYDSIRK